VGAPLWGPGRPTIASTGTRRRPETISYSQSAHHRFIATARQGVCAGRKTGCPAMERDGEAGKPRPKPKRDQWRRTVHWRGAKAPVPVKPAENCGPPCGSTAQGANSDGNNPYFTDQGNGFDWVSGVALSGQSVRLGGQVLAGSVVLFGAAAGGAVAYGGLTRLAPLAVPAAPTSAEIGRRIIGWGQGQTARAVEQTRQVLGTISEARVVEMIKQGLTRDWVQSQLSLYEKALQNAHMVAKNAQLQPRADLMRAILNCWPE